ncbi:MAG TPA: YitT family protein [Candidatus Rifleibacterium sp.]|nr:YitT family protein [Candidatus Rifleibacterium sp.]HPT46835.1 YitT family protein [Candidatus Rifleibacterium sp.]
METVKTADVNETADSYGSWLLITFGTLLSSFGYVIFILPLNLFEGGVTGLGIIAAKFLGNLFADGRMLPVVGIVSWSLTLVIFALSVRILGKSFGAKSIYSTSLLYFSMDIFLWYLQSHGYDVKIRQLLDQELLVASIYGALAIGAGMAIVFNQGAATGGADAMAQVVRKLKHIPVGKTLLVTDTFVLTIGFFTFADAMIGFKTMMYSFIFIFIQAHTLDAVLNGFRANQLVLIITDKPDQIKRRIFTELSRGVTEYKSYGGFSGIEKTTLATVLSKNRVPALRRLIAEADPDSFVVIQDTAMVYGEGFETLPR